MATTGLYITGNLTTLLSAQFSALANNGTAVGIAFNNTPASLGYYWGAFELRYESRSLPTTGNTLDLYLLPSLDGSLYGDTGIQVLPPTHYVGSWALISATSQTLEMWGIPLPPTNFKAIVRNGGGVTMASAAATSWVNFLPYSQQGA